eukprot:scaffold307784_cov39-Attheya_sp.AAC.1
MSAQVGDDPYLLSLKCRSPTTEAVLQELQASHTYIKVIEHNDHFKEGSKLLLLFLDQERWKKLADCNIKALF